MVSYSAAATAGGYGGAAGEIMSCVSVSSKAAKADALYFAVRSSTNPNDTDDNGVYQLAADDIVPTQAKVTAYTIGTNFNTAWNLRGGS